LIVDRGVVPPRTPFISLPDHTVARGGSFPEGNFGRNQLPGRSISLSPLYASLKSDLHVNTSCGPPPTFPSASTSSRIVRDLSGPLECALARSYPKTSRPAEGAGARSGVKAPRPRSPPSSRSAKGLALHVRCASGVCPPKHLRTPVTPWSVFQDGWTCGARGLRGRRQFIREVRARISQKYPPSPTQTRLALAAPLPHREFRFYVTLFPKCFSNVRSRYLSAIGLPALYLALADAYLPLDAALPSSATRRGRWCGISVCAQPCRGAITRFGPLLAGRSNPAFGTWHALRALCVSQHMRAHCPQSSP